MEDKPDIHFMLTVEIDQKTKALFMICTFKRASDYSS